MTLTYSGQAVNSSIQWAQKRAQLELSAWLLSNPDLIPAGFEALQIIDQRRIFELTEHPGTFQIQLSDDTALLVGRNRCFCDPERKEQVCAHRIARSLVLRTLALAQRYAKTTPPKLHGLSVIKKGATHQ